MKVETVIIGDYGKGCGNGNMENGRIGSRHWWNWDLVQVENGDVESVICNSRW